MSRLLAAGLLCAVATTRVGGLTRVSGRHSFASPGQDRPGSRENTVTISIVGTTDLHGAVFPVNGRGGLAVLAGFVNNLRAARAADGGAVLLLDAGDTFLDGMESNLSEGALVVDAYNAMGYTAAAIGNHEFDYGSVDAPGARQTSGDLRGALKARAAQARYPFLAANLIDIETARPVEWPNVRPSVLVEAAGVRVGIVGLMTIDALAATAPVNVAGLRVAPLAPTVTAEASRLRASGADVIVAAAHAGGFCSAFDRQTDLSSCDPSSEIFTLVRSLPKGLVDVVIAGHTHDAVAHLVEGVAIAQPYPRGAAFARVDVAFDRDRRRVARTNVFAPRQVCARQDPESLNCDPAVVPASPLPEAVYEGRVVVPDTAVSEAMAPVLARVRELQATPLGVFVEQPIQRTGDPESPLANLLADTLRDALAVDVVIHGNLRGGLRTDIPEGHLTFGRLYNAFPFDNRVRRVTLSEGELRRVLAEEIRRRRRRGTLAIAGLVVKARCAGAHIAMELVRADGRPVQTDERLVVAGMDSLVAALITARSDAEVLQTAPVLREVVEDWLRRRGGRLAPEQLIDPDRPRWDLPDAVLGGCVGL